MRGMTTFVALVLAAPLAAQELPETPAPVVTSTFQEPFRLWQVDLGLQFSGSDTESSKFLEYREYHYATAPFVRFAGDKDFKYDFTAWNVGQDNGLYRALVEPGGVSIRAELQFMPHRFGADARTVFADDDNGNFTIPDEVQLRNQQLIEQQRGRSPASVNFGFLNGLIGPQVGAASPFDVQLRRDRGSIDVNFTKDRPVEVRLTYLHEERNGTRGSGTAFGFGNVVETAEPIDFRTQDLGLSAEWAPTWGVVRGAVHVNQFTNNILVQTFDNPFRATSSTDGSAYQAPASASIAGAAFARLALPPDNRALTGSLGTTVKFGRHRLTADASYGRWTQDEQFIPFTSNSAINAIPAGHGSTELRPFAATDVSTLPAQSLDGKIDVLSFSSTLFLRPTRETGITARYRRYDLDNKTPRIEFRDGYVRFDGVWEAIPRISVPYGYTNDQAQVSGSFDRGPFGFEAGYKMDRWDRTFRETNETTQHVGYGSLQVKPAGWVILRATYERGKRSFDHYDPEHSEHASFLEAGEPANLTLLRRYDQAEKEIDRLTSLLQLTPGGNATISLSYTWGRDDYVETDFGLVDSENTAYSAEVDYSPTSRLTVFGFYTREDIDSFQRGRQSGATPSTNPLDDWTAAIADKVDSIGGGADLVLKPDTLDLRVNGTYQKVDGNLDIFSPPGGAPANARRTVGGVAGLATFDDTKLLTLNAELGYLMKNGWRLAVGGLFEDFELRDPFAVGSTVYTPGGLFLAGDDGDYRGHLIYTKLSKRW